MDFDNRQTAVDQCVFQAEPIVGQCSCIQDDALDLPPMLLDAVDQFPFQVGLVENDLDAKFIGNPFDLLVHFFQGLGAV